MSKSRKPRPYVQRGNVYLFNPKSPRVEEPSPEVKAQITELEKQGVQTLKLDKEGRVHQVDVDPIDLYVASQGAQAASWLIFHHRARFHRSGYVDFIIPADKDTPMWFRVAFLYVQRKSKTFFATLARRDGIRHYTIKWGAWNTFSPKARARALIRPPANET